MKITPKQYVEALLETVKGKNEKEIKKIISDLVHVLAANNDLGKAELIISELNKIWNKTEGILEVEIKSANELEKDTVKMVSEYLEKKTGSKKIVISQEIDKDLLGGVLISFEDKIIDNSLRNQLYNFKNKIVK